MTMITQKNLAANLAHIIEDAFKATPAGNDPDLAELLAPTSVVTAVAGGMPRDHFLGQPAEDIDLFVLVPTLSTDDQTTIEQMTLSAFVVDDKWEIDLMNPNSGEDMDGLYAYDLMSVFELKHKDTKQKANIIFSGSHSLDELISRFPCNLSKCYTRPYTDTMFSEDFVFGYINKTLEFDASRSTQKYIDKIMLKFPKFKTRIL